MLSVGWTVAQPSAHDSKWVEGRGAQQKPLVITSELAEIEEKINRTTLSKEAREKAQHELNKLRQHRCRPRPQSCPYLDCNTFRAGRNRPLLKHKARGGMDYVVPAFVSESASLATPLTLSKLMKNIPIISVSELEIVGGSLGRLFRFCRQNRILL